MGHMFSWLYSQGRILKTILSQLKFLLCKINIISHILPPLILKTNESRVVVII